MKRNLKMTGTELAQRQQGSAMGMSTADRPHDHPARREGAPEDSLLVSTSSVAEEDEWDREAGRAPVADSAEGESIQSPDDALGLYLRQMGAIPLLTRDQELTLAKRLERLRQRFRHAALSNWET